MTIATSTLEKALASFARLSAAGFLLVVIGLVGETFQMLSMSLNGIPSAIPSGYFFIFCVGLGTMGSASLLGACRGAWTLFDATGKTFAQKMRRVVVTHTQTTTAPVSCFANVIH